MLCTSYAPAMCTSHGRPSGLSELEASTYDSSSRPVLHGTQAKQATLLHTFVSNALQLKKSSEIIRLSVLEASTCDSSSRQLLHGTLAKLATLLHTFVKNALQLKKSCKKLENAL